MAAWQSSLTQLCTICLCAIFAYFPVSISSSQHQPTQRKAPWDHPQCSAKNRKTWVPPITDRKFRLVLPYGNCPDIESQKFGCHGQRNEDCKIYKRFFKDSPLLNQGFFVEMGGYDGASFSNSFIFEQCLGWKGMLIEAHPTNYLKMIENRPCTWNVWGAVCSPETTASHTFMIHDFIESTVNVSEIADYNANQPADSPNIKRVKLSPCRSMSSIFLEANVTVIDFFSLDVEGAEYDVLKSIDFTRVRINVLMVESNMLGNRDPAVPHYYNSTLKMEKITALLTSGPAKMIKLPVEGKLLPACVRKRKRLMIRVFDLHDSQLFVHPSLRDDVC